MPLRREVVVPVREMELALAIRSTWPWWRRALAALWRAVGL